MKNRIIGGYAIFIGISVIAMWIMILNGPALPEGKTAMLLLFTLLTILTASAVILLAVNSQFGHSLRFHPGSRKKTTL